MSIINNIISFATGQANLDAGGDVGDHMAGMMGGFGFMGLGAIFWLIILILLIVVIVNAVNRPTPQPVRTSDDELREELYRLRKEIRDLKTKKRVEDKGED